jgi:DNA-binding phage protein
VSQSPIPPAALRSAFEAGRSVFAASTRTAGPAHSVAPSAAPNSVEQAIASAARASTVDFDFLVAQAQVESAMNPDARARTSSATGLYQFIEGTWLATMQRHGARFGMGDIAAQIGSTTSGKAFVADPRARSEILALRSDPQIAAFMAAGLAEDNDAHLTPILGRSPDHNELYLAHFLGAGGAGRFLSEMARDPDQSAASLFRAPAAANRPVFYDRGGNARSLSGVMNYLGAKLERALANTPGALAGEGVQAALSAPKPVVDKVGFEPQTPPPMVGRTSASFNAPAIAAMGSLAATQPARSPISGILRTTFGADTGAGAHMPSQQVARAYDRLKALGF